jgi:hypothetical protein
MAGGGGSSGAASIRGKMPSEISRVRFALCSTRRKKEGHARQNKTAPLIIL